MTRTTERRTAASSLLFLAAALWPAVPARAQNFPDLQVSDITFSPTPVPGASVVATATLRNIGTRASGSFNVKWFVNGAQVGYGGHGSLNPGETSTGNVRLPWTMGSGDSLFRFDADVDGNVEEEGEANNSWQVLVRNGARVPLADLRVEAMRFNSPPRVGEPTTVTVTLRNAGSAGTGVFNVRWSLSGVEIAAGSHSPLGAGQVSNDNVTLFWTPTSPGTHRLRFEADTTGFVTEHNETNNAFEATTSVAAALPDLVVDDISFSSTPTFGQLTVATARLRNVGQTASPGFTVKWFLDGVQVGYGAHAPLGPGQTSNDNVRFNWTPASPGAHRLRFEADADRNVDETNEGNNSWEEQVSVIDPRPDLVVDDITFSSPPTLRQTTTATARLRNLGLTGSVGFTVKWFLDGVQVGYGAHGPLGPGQTSTDNVRFDWTPSSPGTHRLRFEADADRNVEETNEGNNSWRRRSR